jgi:hypothetical protein
MERPFALGHAPRVKVVEVRELQAFEDIAAVTVGRGLERLDRDLRQVAFCELPELEHVDRNAFCFDPDTAAVRDNA